MLTRCESCERLRPTAPVTVRGRTFEVCAECAPEPARVAVAR